MEALAAGFWGFVGRARLFGGLRADGGSLRDGGIYAASTGLMLGAAAFFAAGAILTMLASTLFPEAYEEGGHLVGVVTTIGFLIAFLLSRME